jgi:hypothetical protein
VREDLGLDLLDVLVQPVDHRLVVVDDPVHDRVQHRPRPEAEQVGPALDPLAHVDEGAGRRVADRDHELGPMNSMISPNSTVSVSPTYRAVLRTTNRVSS